MILDCLLWFLVVLVAVAAVAFLIHRLDPLVLCCFSQVVAYSFQMFLHPETRRSVASSSSQGQTACARSIIAS